MNYSKVGRFILLVAFLLMAGLIANINLLLDAGFSEYNVRNELIFMFFTTDFEKRSQYVNSALMGVFPCALFSFFESAEVIRDRNIDMDHIIVRYPLRRRFLGIRIRRTVMETFLYMLMSIGLYFVLAVRASGERLHPADVIFCAGFLLSFALFCEFHILLMNLLRMYLSQDKIILTGFLCYAIEAVAACCSLGWMNYLNPFYYILVRWDMGPAEKAAGLLLLLLLNAVVIAVMCRMISKVDIGIENENL